MPITPTYPGVYVEELPSGVHTIIGASTSETAFIDYFPRGPVGKAVRITNFNEFERQFGGLNAHSEASYAIMQYFLNGGQIAWVVRVTAGSATAAEKNIGGNLTVTAANPGDWGNKLGVSINYTTHPLGDEKLFNLIVGEVVTVKENNQPVPKLVPSETHQNLSTDPNSPNYAIDEVNHASELVRLSKTDGITQPPEVTLLKLEDGIEGTDGDVPPDADGNSSTGTTWTDTTGAVALSNGLNALDKTSFNILCLPAASALKQDANNDSMKNVITDAVKKCQDNRAFLIIDVRQDTKTKEEAITLVNDPTNKAFDRSDHAAVYYPRITIPDPLNGNKPRNVGPSGTIAGLYARIDSNRGVWKAPAGTEATLSGVTLVEQLTDNDNGALNPLGINALRALPVFGNLCWGARTLDGADVMTSDFKYIPVRRLTSYIETSLYESTKWAVFEPNGETLWSQLRMSIGTFMADLAKQGAFYRYVVTCDDTTTTPSDIEKGIVNIVVAFAPVKPAEFVVLKIQQLAGQAAA